MAVKDGKTVNLIDVCDEAQKAKPHSTIKEAAQDVFQDIPSVISEAFRRGKEKHKGDFFIEILIKIEMLVVVKDTVHPFINVTRSCPNPHLKQWVIYYDSAVKKTRTLWMLPDKFNAAAYSMAPHKFKDRPENLKYVHDHNSGKLQAMADAYNKNIKE